MTTTLQGGEEQFRTATLMLQMEEPNLLLSMTYGSSTQDDVIQKH